MDQQPQDSKKSQRRTLEERIKDIFQFIDSEQEIFPKSRLKEIGLNPRTAEKWLKLIEYIQNQPKIRLIQTGHNTLIEKVEGKYQALMRRMAIDQSVPFEQRLQYLTDYLRSLYSREKILDFKKIDELKVSQNLTEINNKTTSIEEMKIMIESLKFLNTINPIFNKYIQELSEIEAIQNDDSLQEYEFLKKKKQFMWESDLQKKIKKVLEEDILQTKLIQIEKEVPDFKNKVYEIKKFFKL